MEEKNKNSNDNLNTNNKYVKLISVILFIFIIVILLSRIYIGQNSINMQGDLISSKKIEKLEISTLSTKVDSKHPQKINIKIEPVDSYAKDLTWTISDPDIVDLKENIIYGKEKGKVKVSIGNKYIKSNTIEFESVDFLSSIEIENKIEKLPIRSEHKFKIKYTPENADNKDIKIESSNPDIVKVKESDPLTIIGNKKGKATIKFKDTFNNVLYETNIEVLWERITNIILDEKEITIGKNQKYIIYSKVEPDNATYTDLEYRSLNEDIVKIDKYGIVTAVKEGIAEIEVTADDKKVIKKYTVNVVSTPIYGVTKYTTDNYPVLTGANERYEKIAETKTFEKIEVLKDMGNRIFKNKERRWYTWIYSKL